MLGITITDEQLKQFIANIEDIGRQRNRAGHMVSDVDFIVGVLATAQWFLSDNVDEFGFEPPDNWRLNPLRGESVFPLQAEKTEIAKGSDT